MARSTTFLFLLGWALVQSGCSGGSTATNSPGPTPNGPALSVSPTSIAASVTVGEAGSASLSVRNGGDEVLTYDATTAVPWISGLDNAMNRSLNPGQADSLPLQLSCAVAGQQTAVIDITSNAASPSNATIPVTVDCGVASLQIQINENPAGAFGTPAAAAQANLAWEITSSQSGLTASFAVSASDPAISISNAQGAVGPGQVVSNALSLACPAPRVVDASLTIDVDGVTSIVPWQAECVATLEGNASFESAEAYQGPLAIVIDANLNVTAFVDMVAGRPAVLLLEIGHDSGAIPDLVVDVAGTPLSPQLDSVRTPANSGSGRWESVYSMAISGALMDPANVLSISIDPSNQIAETNETDNSLDIPLATLALELVGVFKPVFIPINAEGRTPAAIVPDDYLESTLDFFPVGSYQASVGATYPYQGGNWDWQTAVNELVALWNSQADSDEFYHGIYRQPNGFSGGTTGVGLVGFPVSVSTSLDSPLGSSLTIAHEFGHNFGLSHAPGGCGEPNVDPNYPHPFAAIGPTPGWLSSEARFIAPEDGYFDVMSYCHPQFVSDYHYQRVVDATFPGQLNIVGQNVSPGAMADTGSLALSGTIDEHGIWRLTHQTLSRKAPRDAVEGPFTVVLHDASGLALARQTLDYYRTDHGRLAVWALRLRLPSEPVAMVRVWDQDGNLMLDADVAVTRGN